MAFGIGKGLTAPLMVVNFCLYFIAACLAGSILNRNLDANIGRNDDIQIGEFYCQLRFLCVRPPYVLWSCFLPT